MNKVDVLVNELPTTIMIVRLARNWWRITVETRSYDVKAISRDVSLTEALKRVVKRCKGEV